MQEADTWCTLDGQAKISLFNEEIHSQDQSGQSKSTTWYCYDTSLKTTHGTQIVKNAYILHVQKYYLYTPNYITMC